MKEIHIFTDGSTLNNQDKQNRKGGIGVFFGDDDPRNISCKLIESKTISYLNNVIFLKKVTNQVAELLACIKGIETLLSTQLIIARQIVIYTDSMYIVNMMAEWAKNWEKKGWKRYNGKSVDNLDLVKKLYYYSKNLGVIFRHVKAHKKEPSKDSEKYFKWYGNNKADYLAVSGAKKI